MSDFDSFDDSVDRAWQHFQSGLADHLGAMDTTASLVLQSLGPGTGDGHAALVRFLVNDDRVSCWVPANGDSETRRAPTAAAETRLVDLGWALSDRSSDGEGLRFYWVAQPRRRADQLAAMSVTALREVWNVPHPSFLRAGSAGRPAELPFAANYSRDDLPAAPDPQPNTEAAQGIVFPRDRDHLRELVGNFLTRNSEDPPFVDADGDFELRFEKMAVFVKAHPTEPYVQIWVPLLHWISNRTQGAEIVAELNAEWPLIKFVLVEGRLCASINLMAQPFVPRHLEDMLGRMPAFLATFDDRFAARFGTVTFRQPQETVEHECEPEFPPGLMAVIDLGPDAAGALGARRVAEACGYDRDTLLEYIHISSEQEAEWRGHEEAARRSPNQEDLELCESEAKGWSLTTECLRAALRLVDSPGRHRAPDPTPEPHRPDTFGHPTEPTLFDEPT
ncbi:T3SS (YopN, CesT) and YbjN peptide-binding chaperone 1 [Rhodococcus tukisamuensis]|uniref:Uncharacterized protein n=1 Tax=Rhodococcus tukisamuensis TaxID=168276 RepID=A0A1G7B5Q7_9NOCA|nr:hypothetical protein [Rhodococcus tukisamuensis]SDE22187.1 hypothetical protein SAMN05444580_11281 [Rhodococcus tukisamuensis]